MFLVGGQRKPGRIEEGFIQNRSAGKGRRIRCLGGTEFIQFLAALAVLHQDDLKNRMNSSVSSYPPCASHPFLHIILFLISSWCKIASVARD